MPSCFAWLRSRSGLLAAPPAAPRPPGSLRCPPSAPLQSATARRPKNLSPTGPFSLLPASAGQGLAVIPLRDISVGFFCLFRFCLVICFSGCVCGALGPCFFFRKNHIRFLAATRYSSRLMPCGGAHFRFLPVLFFFIGMGGISWPGSLPLRPLPVFISGFHVQVWLLLFSFSFISFSLSFSRPRSPSPKSPVLDLNKLKN